MLERTVVQLAPPSRAGSPPDDVATALTTAVEQLGQRPAVTVLHPAGREEQGVASLAQWAAKGAHLLTLDLLLAPGDRIRLDTRPSWQAAAVCLAAWWAGIEVTLDGPADVAVLHESRTAPEGAAEVLWLGDALDGSPTRPVDGEAWAQAVQAFPDQPPAPGAAASRAALHGGAEHLDQRAVLTRAATLGEGTAGIEVAGHVTIPPIERRVLEVVALAARPFVVHRPTVVARDVGRAAASGDRVAVWL